jgi:hypothetical protein
MIMSVLTKEFLELMNNLKLKNSIKPRLDDFETTKTTFQSTNARRRFK